MSAGVCGKRAGYEELFGSSSSPVSKRSRCSSFGSPTRSPESETRQNEQMSCLLQMFPGLDPQLIENVLRSNGNKIEDSVESLQSLSYADASARDESHCDYSVVIGNCSSLHAGNTDAFTYTSKQNVDGMGEREYEYGAAGDGSEWVELFVKEMTNATDINDARSRAARILEAFEQRITCLSRPTEEVQQEHASLKEHLHNLFNDNQILKKAVAIQHERNIEQEQKMKEVQHLKHTLSQYQEQARNLELHNYALKINLQRAQGSNSAFSQFHPDIC